MVNQQLIKVAVCGAHMRGLPLNSQLLTLGGEFVQAIQTSPNYKLFVLTGFSPPRPGLLKVIENGSEIDLEIWQLPIENYGKFVAGVPSPLGFGMLTLADGREVQGFLCEAYATDNAIDISYLGGWRNYLKKLNSVE